MLSFDEKLRLKTLISDTVILLCKNGLVPKLKGEFVIEGLIGISLERDDLMLVSINERLRGLEPNADDSDGSSQLDDSQEKAVTSIKPNRKRQHPVEIEHDDEGSPNKYSLIDIQPEQQNPPHQHIGFTAITAKQERSNALHYNTNILPNQSDNSWGGVGGDSPYSVSPVQRSVKLDQQQFGGSDTTGDDDDLVMIKHEIPSSKLLPPIMQPTFPTPSMMLGQSQVASAGPSGPSTSSPGGAAPGAERGQQTSQFLPTDIQHNELEYFYSVRGSRKVAVRGYAYTLDRMGKFGDKYLRCDRRAIHCKGKLKINTENNVIAIRNHNHAPDDSRMQGMISRSKTVLTGGNVKKHSPLNRAPTKKTTTQNQMFRNVALEQVQAINMATKKVYNSDKDVYSDDYSIKKEIHGYSVKDTKGVDVDYDDGDYNHRKQFVYNEKSFCFTDESFVDDDHDKFEESCESPGYVGDNNRSRIDLDMSYVTGGTPSEKKSNIGGDQNKFNHEIESEGQHNAGSNIDNNDDALTCEKTISVNDNIDNADAESMSESEEFTVINNDNGEELSMDGGASTANVGSIPSPDPMEILNFLNNANYYEEKQGEGDKKISI